ncbi:hypothetical protein [Streptomyces sp. NPDC050287]|uniref:hypothetical protein n=1 Tax=Streptomyces sp. NPDC050287 TaxID=3365608 RepID=UPI003799876F
MVARGFRPGRGRRGVIFSHPAFMVIGGKGDDSAVWKMRPKSRAQRVLRVVGAVGGITGQPVRERTV